MLHVDGGVHVDPRAQQLLDVLIALGVPAARGVGVCELIHQYKTGPAGDGGIDVELGERDAVVFDFARRDLFEAIDELGGFGSIVRFDITGYDIDAAAPGGLGGLQHGVGLAYAGGIAEKDLEMAALRAVRL